MLFRSYERLVLSGQYIWYFHSCASLIEQRFERLFPGLGKTTTWSSIVLTKAEHIKFNTAWRMEIGLRNWKSKITTVNATKQDVINAAQRIYKDYPEIIELIKKL